ncbi:GRAM domain-containing protein 1B [Amphibalanus amphitrite]|uniref:GRAM domain-containing protein 1B n=1 Tax=Amphibalanus amphitrite TaxID=1232801 RepID=A0A6A4VRJ6_AMPAM|nr:GRAM domain-containing protein 1B [Amphibalanus amphitrite]KAF0293313.1 GRAM domain-containing protein 1B [Amphibalanus amphitrite]
MSVARRQQRQSEEPDFSLPDVAEVPALSCQPPSSPDQSPEADRFFDTHDDRLRRQPSRSSTGSRKLTSARSFENLHQTVSSQSLPVQESNGSSTGPTLHRSASSHSTPLPGGGGGGGSGHRRSNSGAAMAPAGPPSPSTAGPGPQEQGRAAQETARDGLGDFSRQEAGSEASLSVTRPDSTRSSDSGRKESKRARRTPWYSLLRNTYKQRCDEFRRTFEIPSDERLIVDYSCAQVDVGKMIYHGRLYISQNYICFTSNIFKWNVSFCVALREVRAITKMNVLVFPSGINIETASEKYVLSSFASRDRAFVNIENIWRNCIDKQVLSASQLWQMVHELYGSELGLTSDDDDYVDPSAEDDSSNKLRARKAARLSASGSPQPGRSHSTGSSPPASALSPLCAGAVAAAGGPLAGLVLPQVVVAQPPHQRRRRHTVMAAPEEFYHGAGPLEADSAAGSDVPPAPTTPTTAAPLRSPPGRDDDESDTTEDEPAAFGCDGSQHVGRHVTSLELPLHVDQVFTLLFTHSDFSEAFQRERKYYDVQSSEWQDGEEAGTKVRSVRFQLDVNHPLGKTTTVTEEQTMLPSSQAGYMYAVDAEVNNSGVPMADVFYLIKHYCLVKLSSRKTRLNIWCMVKFRKSTLFKGFIEKTSNDGMDEHHSLLNQMLLDTTGEISKHRRAKRRRAGSKAGAGADLLSEASVTLSPRGAKVSPLSGGESRPATSDRLLLAVMAFMLLLVLMNGYLYLRMSRLGEQTEAFAHRDILAEQLSRSRPHSVDDCLRVVQQQDRLHRAELHKWQEIVHSVTALLKQSESALATLQATLESHRARDWPAAADPSPVPGAGVCVPSADQTCPVAS